MDFIRAERPGGSFCRIAWRPDGSFCRPGRDICNQMQYCFSGAKPLKFTLAYDEVYAPVAWISTLSPAWRPTGRQ